MLDGDMGQASIERINVTKSFLPPLEEYKRYLEKIWSSNQLTNQGNLLKEFEQKAQEYLGVRNFHFVTNGTLALQVALRSLGITGGEIITTPFSYVATTSTILWERCKPVFVDIEPKHLCIDADKIEAAITQKTKAILAVHVFGHACDVEKIERIAKEHKLKVIYDGAHAFGAKYKGRSLLSFGDITTCSFHATKLFHTIEGGCVIAKDKVISEKIELIKRFGHHGDDHHMLGINAKASEFQAAMGLCNLNYIDKIISDRGRISKLYDSLLGDSVLLPVRNKDTKHNHAYYPVILKNEERLQSVSEKLKKHNIHPRRYFYPSLNTLKYLKSNQNCPISEDIANRILCLPLFSGLSEKAVNQISGIIAA
jgi:dTDP-4-amino-4,6-dideoxygalactose transaminase